MSSPSGTLIEADGDSWTEDGPVLCLGKLLCKHLLHTFLLLRKLLDLLTSYQDQIYIMINIMIIYNINISIEYQLYNWFSVSIVVSNTKKLTFADFEERT